MAKAVHTPAFLQPGNVGFVHICQDQTAPDGLPLQKEGMVLGAGQKHSRNHFRPAVFEIVNDGPANIGYQWQFPSVAESLTGQSRASSRPNESLLCAGS